jgi:hypothetical protein
MMLSPPSTRLSGSRERRSSAFVRKGSDEHTQVAVQPVEWSRTVADVFREDGLAGANECDTKSHK